MKKRLLLYVIALCLVCAGCGKSGDPHSQGRINWDDLEGNQNPGNYAEASGEPEISDSDYQRTPADHFSDYEPPMTRTVDCHLCHGDGICYHCNGDGFRGGRRCSVCRGTGNCDACEGAGSLEVLEIGGVDYTVCTACHGSGICGACDGAGKIVHQYSTLGRVDRDCSLCHGSGDCLGCKGTGLRELAGF